MLKFDALPQISNQQRACLLEPVYNMMAIALVKRNIAVDLSVIYILWDVGFARTIGEHYVFMASSRVFVGHVVQYVCTYQIGAVYDRHLHDATHQAAENPMILVARLIVTVWGNLG